MSNKITYRAEKGSQLSSLEVDANFRYLDQRLDKVSEQDYIIHDAGYSSGPGVVTVQSGMKWSIGGVEYMSAVDTAFSIDAASAGMYRVDSIYLSTEGVIDIRKGVEKSSGYAVGRNDVLVYLSVYIDERGVQRVSSEGVADYLSKLALSWVDVDHAEAMLSATEQKCNINIVGGNKVIDGVPNGIFGIRVPEAFQDGYSVSIRNMRTSYVTLVHSEELSIYTGEDYSMRPGEIVVFVYDKRAQSFAVSGALDIRLDWKNVDDILGVDSMRMVVDSSAGDALNPNALHTTLTPVVMRYFKDYTSDAVGWKWSRFSGDEEADAQWALGKNKRVLVLEESDFTSALYSGNVSFMCEAIVNNATVAGVWVAKLVDQAKSIRIQATGTQFKGVSPEYILLRAIVNNISSTKVEWLKDGVLTNINDSVMVYNNQVDSFCVMTLRVTAVDGVVYEDSITLSKVVDGEPGKDGKSGGAAVWVEWMTGEKHYNNANEVYYIYHRPTQTVWKLKDGLDNVTAPVNPDDRYVRQAHLEQVVTKVLVAEGANIAGFIFKDGKMVSQYPSPNNPDLILDGVKGEVIAKKLTIVPGSPADKVIDDKIGGIQVGGRNYIKNSKTQNIGLGVSYLIYWLSEKIKADTDCVISLEDIVFNIGNWDGEYLIHLLPFSGPMEILQSLKLDSESLCLKFKAIKDFGRIRIYLGNSFATGAKNSALLDRMQLVKGTVKVDWTPAPEDTDAKIQDQEMYYQYSVDGVSGWHDILQASDNYERRRKGAGVWSEPLKITGEPGEDGVQLYTWIRFADSPTSGISASAVGKKYVGYAYNKTTSMPSLVYSDYEWQLTRAEPIASNVEPEDRYVGMIWVDTSKKPSEQRVWNGNSWELIGLSIDDIEIGGRNLLTNNTANWEKGWIDLSDGIYKDGALNIRLKQSENILVEANTNYTFSSKSRIVVFFYDKNDSFIESFDIKEHQLPRTIKTKSNAYKLGCFLLEAKSDISLDDLEIFKPKIEKGNVATDWTPAIEDNESELESIREKNRQQERDITNLNTTTDLLNQKTSYLSTTIEGNVVTTGTVEVGDANGTAKAGITGVISKDPSNVSQDRRVVFYAGAGFNDRESSNIQIWDDGQFIAKNANIEGVVKANAGYFGGFQIQAGKIISNNNLLEINGSTASIIMKHKNGVSGIVQGIDSSGSPSLKFYDDKGNLIWEAGTAGIVYIDNIPESYQKQQYYKIGNASDVGSTSLLRKGMDLHFKQVLYYNSSSRTYDSKVTIRPDESRVPILDGYTYKSGNNSDSSMNKKYEDFIYSSPEKLGSKIQDGWYYQYSDLKGMYTYGAGYPADISKTQRIFKIYNGKITESKVWNVSINVAVFPVDPDGGSAVEELDYSIGSQIS